MAQTIIVPLDGSEQAERAVPWGALLARLHGLRLVLLRVVPAPVEAYVPGASVLFTAETYDQLQADERAAAATYLI